MRVAAIRVITEQIRRLGLLRSVPGSAFSAHISRRYDVSNQSPAIDPPAGVAAIIACGYAIWASDDVSAELRDRFSAARIPVVGLRHVRVWGLQVDDERELPGLERTQIPDEEIWEIKLVAVDGSSYEIDSRLLKPAPS